MILTLKILKKSKKQTVKDHHQFTQNEFSLVSLREIQIIEYCAVGEGSTVNPCIKPAGINIFHALQTRVLLETWVLLEGWYYFHTPLKILH